MRHPISFLRAPLGAPLRLSALLCALPLLFACSSAPLVDEGGAVVEKKIELENRLSEAGREAATAHYQTIRYNPASEECGCPAFEILVAGSWWRAALLPGADDGEGAALVTLEERARSALASGDVSHFYITGALDDDPIPLCRNGRFGFELRVDAAHRKPPAPAVE